MKQPEIALVMGSESDFSVMKACKTMIESFDQTCFIDIVSAHRTPHKMAEFANNAQSNGIKVVVAAAGGAAHLPGMIAAYTTLPVIGVPIKSSNSIDGWDSMLSILQMPKGVPVATVALNGAENAALLAIQILATSNPVLQAKLKEYKENLKHKVEQMSSSISKV